MCPVGVFRTFPESPRVIIANSNLVGNWLRIRQEFDRLDKLGLMMYGQMTAGKVGSISAHRASCKEPMRPCSRSQSILTVV
ncbi:MAG: hypothetical protein R2880_18855 [Deinococcales bacterium]